MVGSNPHLPKMVGFSKILVRFHEYWVGLSDTLVGFHEKVGGIALNKKTMKRWWNSTIICQEFG